jgi:hypothetical protein
VRVSVVTGDNNLCDTCVLTKPSWRALHDKFAIPRRVPSSALLGQYVIWAARVYRMCRLAGKHLSAQEYCNLAGQFTSLQLAPISASGRNTHAHVLDSCIVAVHLPSGPPLSKRSLLAQTRDPLDRRSHLTFTTPCLVPRKRPHSCTDGSPS